MHLVELDVVAWIGSMLAKNRAERKNEGDFWNRHTRELSLLAVDLAVPPLVLVGRPLSDLDDIAGTE